MCHCITMVTLGLCTHCGPIFLDCVFLMKFIIWLPQAYPCAALHWKIPLGLPQLSKFFNSASPEIDHKDNVMSLSCRKLLDTKMYNTNVESQVIFIS